MYNISISRYFELVWKWYRNNAELIIVVMIIGKYLEQYFNFF